VVLFSEYSLNLLKHVFFFFDTYTYLSWTIKLKMIPPEVKSSNI
jgi:hypothetical protein